MVVCVIFASDISIIHWWLKCTPSPNPPKMHSWIGKMSAARFFSFFYCWPITSLILISSSRSSLNSDLGSLTHSDDDWITGDDDGHSLIQSCTQWFTLLSAIRHSPIILKNVWYLSCVVRRFSPECPITSGYGLTNCPIASDLDRTIYNGPAVGSYSWRLGSC